MTKRTNQARQQAAAILNNPDAFRDLSTSKPRARQTLGPEISQVGRKPRLPVLEVPDWLDEGSEVTE